MNGRPSLASVRKIALADLKFALLKPRMVVTLHERQLLLNTSSLRRRSDKQLVS